MSYDDEFATYDDIMADMDDRDDRADLMCQWCEDGISLAEAKRIVTMERTRATRERADRAQAGLALLLRHGVGGIDAAHVAQESSYTVNPRSRYGRH